MHINKALLESSDITRHFMTDRERQVKKALCQLLINKGHRKYAERFWKLDFNIIDSTRHPDFTAAISFDDATVFISDGFLGSGEGIFNQLDVLLRHELAHNLMMHQIRLMYVFKKLHAHDPDEAYEHIKCSASLHRLLNIIEDFEISNKRYTSADKKIVRTMMLNGRVIGGLVTEDHRGSWMNMSLEAMYDELSKELIQINSDIRSDPNWKPIKAGTYNQVDMIKAEGAGLLTAYTDVMKPSRIKAPIDIFIKSQAFNKYAEIYKKLVKKLYDALKDLTSDADKQKLFKLVEAIALTGPQEEFAVQHPLTGEVICILYTPEDKMLASDVLKNLSGNINYNPLKFKVKRQQNSQEYKDAWNKVIKTLDSKRFDDDVLTQIRDAIDKA
jgi:vacuolar-type H+-ATPase subunit E/Vma4